MFGICLRYTGNYQDAQDTLQEGFISIFENIRQFGFNGSFEGWIRKIMIHAALRNNRNSNKTIELNNEIQISDEINDDEPDEKVGSEKLLSFIRELPPMYRAVFNLYAIEAYSHKEISEILNISDVTSRSNLSRARSILREKISKHKLKHNQIDK